MDFKEATPGATELLKRNNIWDYRMISSKYVGLSQFSCISTLISPNHVNFLFNSCDLFLPASHPLLWIELEPISNSYVQFLI